MEVMPVNIQINSDDSDSDPEHSQVEGMSRNRRRILSKTKVKCSPEEQKSSENKIKPRIDWYELSNEDLDSFVNSQETAYSSDYNVYNTNIQDDMSEYGNLLLSYAPTEQEDGTLFSDIPQAYLLAGPAIQVAEYERSILPAVTDEADVDIYQSTAAAAAFNVDIMGNQAGNLQNLMEFQSNADIPWSSNSGQPMDISYPVDSDNNHALVMGSEAFTAIQNGSEHFWQPSTFEDMNLPTQVNGSIAVLPAVPSPMYTPLMEQPAAADQLHPAFTNQIDSLTSLKNNSSQESLVEQAIYPSVHISQAGLISVLLSPQLVVEMTADRTIRIIDHVDKTVVAVNSQGDMSCLNHAAVRLYSDGKTYTTEADLYSSRRIKLSPADAGIKFSTPQKGCLFLHRDGVLLNTECNFADLSTDTSVTLLFATSKYGPYMLPQLERIAKSATYNFHDSGGVTVLINDVTINHKSNNDLFVEHGSKSMHISPSNHTAHVDTEFSELSVEGNWTVKIKNRFYSAVVGHESLVVSDSVWDCGVNERGNVFVRPTYCNTDTIILDGQSLMSKIGFNPVGNAENITDTKPSMWQPNYLVKNAIKRSMCDYNTEKYGGRMSKFSLYDSDEEYVDGYNISEFNMPYANRNNCNSVDGYNISEFNTPYANGNNYNSVDGYKICEFNTPYAKRNNYNSVGVEVKDVIRRQGESDDNYFQRIKILKSTTDYINNNSKLNKSINVRNFIVNSSRSRENLRNVGWK